MGVRRSQRCPARFPRVGLVQIAAALGVLALLPLSAPAVAFEGFGFGPTGVLELDVKSDYSHIRIRRANTVRTMAFVRDTGEEALESQVDLNAPHELRFAYLQHMFLSYVFRPQQEKVLIVGLGGGSMVHFLKRYDPAVQVEVVEIDPVVVRLADQYFGVRSADNVKIITADAFEYLATTPSQYDVIYMDAFLKPSRETDSTGVPLRLRTIRFYQAVQKKLTPGGLVVFNLNPHAEIRADVQMIRAAFPQTYLFALPGQWGLVAVAALSATREPVPDMLRRAVELDRRFQASFSFSTLVRHLTR